MPSRFPCCFASVESLPKPLIKPLGSYSGDCYVLRFQGPNFEQHTLRRARRQGRTVGEHLSLRTKFDGSMRGVSFKGTSIETQKAA